MARATVSLTRACHNRCIFCAADPAAPEAQALPAGADAVTFVGGEPTLAPDLALRVRAARAAGARAVGLQTTGRALAAPGVADALADAGLTDVHVSVHGDGAAAHDYHTGVPGSFAGLFAGVAAARARGLTVVATTVLTRSSYRALGRLPWLWQSRGVAAWHVTVPLARGRAEADWDRVVPRLGLALPFALHALEAARKLGLPAFVSGAPLCLLGPFAARRLPAPAVDPPRAYAEACAACPARAACPGVEPTYLARFGGDELAARADAPAPAPHPLAELFVGPGALAAPAGRVMPEPPRAARRALLPVVGRPAPARAEVSPALPKKSGEALREILPGLFEDPAAKEPAS